MNGMGIWICYAAILFASNVLGSVGGFGAGLISIPFLTQLMKPKLVIMASTVTCILNLSIAVSNRKWIDWKKLFIIGGLMCLGLPLGVWGLKEMSVSQLKLALGIFMILLGIYGLLKLWFPTVAEKKIPLPVLYLCLFLGGIVQGAISSGGGLVILYTQQEIQDKKSFRATLALLWSVVSIVTVVQYQVAGTLTGEVFQMAAIGAPAVLGGIYVGGRLCRRMSQRAFLYLIYILILTAGLMNCGGILFA